jgi:hypothetical protein
LSRCSALPSRCANSIQQHRSGAGDCPDLIATLEEDGALLSAGLLVAVIALSVATMTVWETLIGTKWTVGSW